MTHLLTLTLAAGLVAGEERPFDTPQAVWAGYDPRADPLQVETKRVWTEEGITWREFTFLGERVDGEPVRVYAMYAAPADAKGLPAVLHIHGGGQTVSPPWLKLFTKRGYAAMTFNWGGRWENRPEFTQWGKLKQGNHLDARTGPVVRPSQHASSWYHWALVTRRCLTFLERQPEVDPQRLGIFGISMGGTLVWPVAGIDRRVKAACAIYGNGWDSYSPDLTVLDSPGADTEIYRATMEGQSYAMLIQCPLLFLNATNDQHGKQDRAATNLALLPHGGSQAITPNQRHHIALEQGRSLPLFMDSHLKGGVTWPRNPTARLDLDEAGVPRLTVDVHGEAVVRVDGWYALAQTLPTGRHWRKATVTGGQASLPIVDTVQQLYAFANVVYRNGVCLSTAQVQAIPAQLGDAKATLTPSLVLDDLSGDLSNWVRPLSPTDPLDDYTWLQRVPGPGGRPALTHKPNAGHYLFATHLLADPQWRGPRGASLVFDVHAAKPNHLKLALLTHEMVAGYDTFTTEVGLAAGADWQTIALRLEQFHNAKGASPEDWSQLTCLELRADPWQGDPPLFTAFRWQP